MFQVKFDNIPETRHCNNFFFKLSLVVQKFDIKKQKKNIYKLTTFITTTNEKFFFSTY